MPRGLQLDDGLLPLRIAFILSPVARSRPEKGEFNGAKALRQSRLVLLEHFYNSGDGGNRNSMFQKAWSRNSVQCAMDFGTCWKHLGWYRSVGEFRVRWRCGEGEFDACGRTRAGTRPAPTGAVRGEGGGGAGRAWAGTRPAPTGAVRGEGGDGEGGGPGQAQGLPLRGLWGEGGGEEGDAWAGTRPAPTGAVRGEGRDGKGGGPGQAQGLPLQGR